MKIAIYCAGGTVLLILTLLWIMTQIHYRIGGRHLKVVLFGLPIRKFLLENIADISKREPKGFAEFWPNCLKRNHRVLTIELKSGFRKHVLITPKHRYVFLADLKSAIRRVSPTADFVQKAMEDTTDSMSQPNVESGKM